MKAGMVFYFALSGCTNNTHRIPSCGILDEWLRDTKEPLILNVLSAAGPHTEGRLKCRETRGAFFAVSHVMGSLAEKKNPVSSAGR